MSEYESIKIFIYTELLGLPFLELSVKKDPPDPPTPTHRGGIPWGGGGGAGLAHIYSIPEYDNLEANVEHALNIWKRFQCRCVKTKISTGPPIFWCCLDYQQL